jgi:transposase
LEDELLKGPRAHGYETELWTLARIGKLIPKLFGVRYHNSHVWVLMTKLGWSCQKPARRAKQRDEAEVESWHKVRWPKIKRGHSGQAP